MLAKAALYPRGACLAAGLALFVSIAHPQHFEPPLVVEISEGTAAVICNGVPLKDVIEAIALRTGIIVYSKASLDEAVTHALTDESIPSLIRKILRDYDFTLHYVADSASGKPVFGSRLWILADDDDTATPVWSIGEPLQEWTHSDAIGDARRNRLQALSNIETWNNHAPLSNELLVALGDPAVAVRAEAASVLGEIASPQAIMHLRDVLYDSDKRVRIAAIDALADSADDEAAMTLAPLLQDADPDIRREVIDALAEIDSKIAHQLLAGALADETEINRETAAGYVAEIATTRTANRF